MLKIGEFSKLSHLTIKTLRFYEKEGLLKPCYTDEMTGYRYYEVSQLDDAAKLKTYRQLDLSIAEIKRILEGESFKEILKRKNEWLQAEKEMIDSRMAWIEHYLQSEEKPYEALIKEVPAYQVFYFETKLDHYSDMMEVIPKMGEECATYNPTLKCVEPDYCFVEYLDGEYKESDIAVRYSQAVETSGKESENIHFQTIDACKVLSIFHHGSYDELGAAYAYLMDYVKEHQLTVTGLARECYIDGIWNKESVSDWLTEIQIPIQD